MSARLSLVTGGGGFIGRHLVRRLLDRGERVRVLDVGEPIDVPSDVEYIRGSICDADAVRRALGRADRLYHLAANPNLWARNKDDFRNVNFGGTQTVLAEAARCDLERIIYTSTESILKNFRRASGATPTDENVHLTLRDMTGPYTRSKYLAEREAFQAARRGLPVVIVNPTLPIGPGDVRLTPPTRMLLGFLTGRSPAYLECTFNMIDARDVAEGHILAAERGRVGERYILGHENLALSEVLAILAEITGRAMPRIKIPYWVAWMTAAVSETIADYVTRAQPIAPLTGVRLARTPMTFDAGKAARELGLIARPVRQSLTDAVEWMVRAGHLELSRPIPVAREHS